MKMAYHLLPTEIVVKIFSYLNVSDRLCAFLVCKHWYSLSSHSRICKDFAYVLQDDASVGMQILKDNKRPIQHLTFKDTDLQSDNIKFWSSVGSSLRVLKFHSCDIAERLFVDVLKNCLQLRVLNIIGCNGLFISGTLLEKCLDVESNKLCLPHLKELSLASNRYLSDGLFNKLVRIMPNLVKLSIEGCQITFHSGIYKRFYPGGDAQEPSRAVFTFQNIMKFFEKKRDQMKSINLSRTLFDSGSLKNLILLQCPNLEELHLVSCEQLTHPGILYLCNHQSNLRVLDLSLCSQLFDQTLLHICNTLLNLRVLRLRRCHNLTDHSVGAICQLTKLECLDLSSCEKVSPNGFKMALGTPLRCKLKELVLSYCNATDEVVISLTKFAKNLTHLDLSYCLALTDVSLHAISTNLNKLETLRIAWCKEMTDVGLSGIVDPDSSSLSKNNRSALNIPMVSSRNLSLRDRFFSIGNCARDVSSQKCNSELDKEAGESGVKNGDSSTIDGEEPVINEQSCDNKNLGHLKYLKMLDLCGCINIGNWGINLGVKFLELRYLNLSLCQNLTDQGLVTVGLQNPSLETLILSQCHQLTDDGVSRTLCNLTRIRYLDLQGCRSLTNSTLKSIRLNCPNLRHINVTLCSLMSIEDIESLELDMPRIHTIHK